MKRNAIGHLRTGDGLQRRAQMQVAFVATLIVAVMWALITFSGGNAGGGGRIQVQAPAIQAPAIQAPVVQPGQAFHFTPAQTTELKQLTDTPAKAKAFQANLKKGMAAFGLKLTDKAPVPPSGQGSLNVQSANYTGGATTEDVFSQGWSRDHWWLIMSYADTAYIGTAAAGGACLAYLPWFVCGAVSGIIASWVRGWGYANNHGIWMGVYRSGWVTGGRW